MFPTSPTPHVVVCSQRKQQLGPNMTLRDVLTGAVWKVTATTTEVFEDQSVCVPHSYLWPRRPPPPTRPGSELETSRAQSTVATTPSQPETQAKPSQPRMQPTEPAYPKPDKPTNPTHLI